MAMSKKIIFSAVLPLFLLFITGCSTSHVRFTPPEQGQVAPPGTELVGNVRGWNWGLFLFNCKYLPLASGNPNRPGTSDCHVFSNRVKPGYMREMLQTRAKKAGADRIDGLQIKQNATGYFSLWIVWRRDISGSALAVSNKKQ